MERQNNLLFTIWYGVFDRHSRWLAYASGGHPPAQLVGEPNAAPQPLSTGGRVLGIDPAAEFRCASLEIKRGSRLYVFSDGAYELARPDGSAVQLSDLVQQIQKPPAADRSKLDELVEWAREVSGQSSFEDDVSIMEIGL